MPTHKEFSEVARVAQARLHFVLLGLFCIFAADLFLGLFLHIQPSTSLVSLSLVSSGLFCSSIGLFI
jgi:hypothetical protein